MHENIKFKPISEIINSKPSTEWLIKKIIAKNRLIAITAQPAAGKTLLAIDMGLSIAKGLPWQGNKTNRGNVFYILGDGQTGFVNRIKAWEIKNNTSVSETPFYISNVSLPINTVEGATELINAISATGVTPDLIIADTFATAFEGDENSAQAMSDFIRNCKYIINYFNNCAFIVIHHTGNSDKSRMRGSSALNGALDSSYLLSVEENKTRTFKCIKSKDDPEIEPIYYKIQSVNLYEYDEDGEIVSSVVLEQTDAQPTSKANPERETALECLKTVIVNNSADYKLWRDEFFKRVGSTKNANATRAAFSRHKEYFISNNIISEHNGIITFNQQ